MKPLGEFRVVVSPDAHLDGAGTWRVHHLDCATIENARHVDHQLLL
jgi:hypothetical protein